MIMKKLLFILTNLLILVVSGQAQSFTTVTATLTDSNAQIWTYATVIATLRPVPGNPAIPLNSGFSITDSPQTVITDATGTFILILDDTSKITPAGALWNICIYPNATVVNGNCISLAITGGSVNLSGVLSSILTPPTVYAGPAINRAYSQNEVSGGTGSLYWDTSSNSLKGCIATGGVCTWITIGSISAPGSAGQIAFNNGSGGFAASANLSFNTGTNTFSTINISATSITATNFISVTNNHAASGVIRLASTDTGPCYRNNANSADLCWSKNASDQFTVPGVLLNASLTTPSISNPTSTGTDNGAETLINKILTSPTINTPTITSPSTTGTDSGAETLNNKTLGSPVINTTATGTALQGTDSKLLTSGTISGAVGSPLCIDANSGATTSSCNVQTQASFNAPQRVVLGAGTTTSATPNTQLTVLTESVSFPSTAGTYRALVSYNIWATTGANVCNAGVVDATNNVIFAPSGQNPANVGYAGFTGTELSSRTYAASAAVTFNAVIVCNGASIPITTTDYSGAALVPAPSTYLSVTPVLSN